MNANRSSLKSLLAEGSTRGKHGGLFIVVSVFIILLISGLYLRFAWARYETTASSEAIMLAQSVESFTHPEHIAKLTGGSEDVDDADYIMLKGNLIRLVGTTNPIRFAYVLGERAGNVVILVDSELSNSTDYSPPGQVYEEANAIFMEAFRSGNPTLTPPLTDRWGTWISALVPVKNQADGKVVAVLGFDYSVSEWNNRLWEHMIPDIIIILCMLLLFIALLWTWLQHAALKNLSEKLVYNEALFRSAFDQAPIGVAIMKDKHFVIRSKYGHHNINPMFEKIIGRTSADLDNLTWTEITHPEDLTADEEYFERFKNGEISGYTIEKRFIKPVPAYGQT